MMVTQILTKLAGNMRKISHSSSDPIKSVVSGDAAASLAIDFYANSKISDLGEEEPRFVLYQKVKQLLIQIQ